MPLTERRYDRLAVRLSLIISRLVAGETLEMQKLATEFDVSVRTLYRDFRERLMYLDLECHQGCYRLRAGAGPRGELDVLTFAYRAGLAGIFPGLDRRLAGALLASDGTPCLVWQSPQPITATSPLVFYRLVSAITGSQRVLLLADGERCDGLAPYRLISLDGCWYLTGELNGHITVHPLAVIHAVTILNTPFTPRKRLSQLTTQADFIRALPHFRCPNLNYCRRVHSLASRPKRLPAGITTSPLKTTRAVTSVWWFATPKAGWSGGRGTLNRMPVRSSTGISGRMAFAEHYPPTDCCHLPAYISAPDYPIPYASHRRWRFLLPEKPYDNTERVCSR